MPWFSQADPPFGPTIDQVSEIVEKAFRAGWSARVGDGEDAPSHVQDFMDWCDSESERMRIHQGDVPVIGWLQESAKPQEA